MSLQPITFTEPWADRGPHRIRVRDYPGDGPAIILMHGFPDDQHLYDQTLPHLTGRRRVVTFDFLGWGESDKPPGYPYTAANQTGDLDAVITRLGLDQVVLVAHDSSGPPAIDWALEHPQRIAALVLLNTYYGWIPRLRPPEAIILYASPILRNLARPAIRLAGLERRLYFWQVGRFIRDEAVRRDLLPQYYTRFRAARPAFLRLNADLPRTLISRTRRTSQLRAFQRPVRIVFGSDDPYLNTHVARRFAQLFPTAELDLIDGAQHYVQVDEPELVAAAILNSDRGPFTRLETRDRHSHPGEHAGAEQPTGVHEGLGCGGDHVPGARPRSGDGAFDHLGDRLGRSGQVILQYMRVALHFAA